ncbi:MAG: helix-turn-helix transcriptional regulator [Methanomicrobiales archaeon]|jgi:putative transcriptional regulator|nr:helix-turn-helix transcriptional regulator [Methanomicrobiales archaeon]
MAFKTRIKVYRAMKNLTQAELAAMVGVRRETLNVLEAGKYNPSLQLAHDIARALDATIYDIFIFDDDDTVPES